MILGRIFRAVVLATTSLVLLAACQGSDKPVGTPPAATPTAVGGSSATAAPSSSETSSAPARVPPAARADSAAGAEAFVRFYFDTLNDAFVRPAASKLDGLATARCLPCKQARQEVARFADVGEHLAQGPYRLSTMVELPESERSARAFQLPLVQRAQPVLNREGLVQRQQSSERHLLEVLVVRTDNGWQIEDLADASVTKP